MGKFSEFKLPLKSMTPGVTTFEYHLGRQFFVNMESADIHDADLDVKLTVEYKDDLYSLAFEVKGTITLLCDRCLDDLVYPVDTTYNIAVEYGDGYNDESDTLLVIPQSDNYLNVAYMLYDTVALTIPMKHVHPAGKCNRAMSAVLKKHHAGGGHDDDSEMMENLIEEIDTMDSEPTGDDQTSQATDPRWAGLEKLKDNTDENN